MRRRRLIAATAVLMLLLVIGAAGAYWLATRKVADVHNGLDTPFTLTTDSSAPADPGTRKHTSAERWGQPWPFYGRTLDRVRSAANLTGIHPPYRVLWRRPGYGLLEYPPTYADGVLYVISDVGHATAYELRTGRMLWHRSMPETLASPAISGDNLYFPASNRVYALDRRTGRTVWSVKVGSDMEGSPAVWRGRIYVGELSGLMRAMSAKTGKTIWTYRTSGAVKHGPALSGGRLYFGDYAGVMYCLNATNGRLLWRTQTAGLSSGLRSGTFYSTPAVAYGRVYIGNTDDKLYSFVASTGQIAWTSTMPWWVYGSPAVSEGRVFDASADGTFAAFNARTGSVLWRHQLPYHSLSSPTVIGPLVYVADRGASGQSHGHLYAYNPGNGHLVWHFPDGKYSTVIAANNRLVVAGALKIYVLKPVSR